MSDNSKDLEARAQSCIAEALYNVTTYDSRTLRESVMDDYVPQDAENACIYTSDCEEIIRRYEREFGSEAEDICDSGKTYKASEFAEAMVSYANAVAYTAMQSYASTALNELYEAADEIADLAGVSADDLTIGASCPHGWAVHAREDAQGTHFWEPGQLEGCKAIARKVGDVWLSYTWTPEAPEADAELRNETTPPIFVHIGAAS